MGVPAGRLPHRPYRQARQHGKNLTALLHAGGQLDAGGGGDLGQARYEAA